MINTIKLKKTFQIALFFFLLHSQYIFGFNKKDFFISSSTGLQISGIKKEDFTSSNISPSFNVNAGLWITKYFGLSAGIKGFYFNYIEDNIKHKYTFLYGNILYNMTKKKNKIDFIYYQGIGIFNNKHNNKKQLCGNIGILKKFNTIQTINVYFDVSAIFGWKIYQTDEDILPNINIRIMYDIKK